MKKIFFKPKVHYFNGNKRFYFRNYEKGIRGGDGAGNRRAKRTGFIRSFILTRIT